MCRGGPGSERKALAWGLGCFILHLSDHSSARPIYHIGQGLGSVGIASLEVVVLRGYSVELGGLEGDIGLITI